MQKYKIFEYQQHLFYFFYFFVHLWSANLRSLQCLLVFPIVYDLVVSR